MKFLLAAFAVVSCQAQSPAFDVASVKMNKSAGQQVRIRRDPGRLDIENLSLKAMVRFAYDVRDIQISGGPPWFDADHWDVSATAGREITEDDRKKMLQALLTERFQLAIRRETKELPVYALVVAKNGAKLKANSDGKPQKMMLQASGSGLLRMKGEDVKLPEFASALFGQTGRMVLDRTGLGGGFDFELEWVPDPANMPMINGAKPDGSKLDGASIFTAMQEQLGLRLEATKGPVEILVIERAEKATEN